MDPDPDNDNLAEYNYHLPSDWGDNYNPYGTPIVYDPTKHRDTDDGVSYSIKGKHSDRRYNENKIGLS